MNGKRVTIYDIAKDLGISASYVSRALNNRASISQEIITAVKLKAKELNYKHNSHAANLRRGSSKTIGVIVPHINQSFFSEAIAGIEEICFANHHNLIICQSHESFTRESQAIETLIHQNVDCILISISAETQVADYLEEIRQHDIQLVQFDRCLDQVESLKVTNDNKQASYEAVRHLVKEGYRRIAFIGGPDHLTVFRDRKAGYLEAMQASGLDVFLPWVREHALESETAATMALEMLQSPQPPDAFFTVSDHQSLGVLQAARSLGVKVPQQLGIFGFANETFSDFLMPRLSTVDQKSKELGKTAARLYFDTQLHPETAELPAKSVVIRGDILVRESSSRTI